MFCIGYNFRSGMFVQNHKVYDKNMATCHNYIKYNNEDIPFDINLCNVTMLSLLTQTSCLKAMENIRGRNLNQCYS